MVGCVGGGTLTVSGGGQVSAASGVLAQDYRSRGTATVTGPASRWTNDGWLTVGASSTGTGTLMVADGGQATTTFLNIGSGSTVRARVSGGERLVITDGASGRRVGASFGAIPAGTTFSAMPIGAGDLAALAAVLGEDDHVAAAWDFATNLAAGSEVLLSVDVGPGLRAEDLSVWRLVGGTWAPVTGTDVTYNGASGVATFTATLFSGYAVVVPEPAAIMVLAGAAGVGWAGRRRRR